MLVEVIDQKNKKVKDIELGESADAKLNKAVLYYAVKAQRNNLRHGTVKVKTRGEVNRTKKKVYRQKGTGNARHAARSANIYVGGGNVHGPSPRSYFEQLNKKAKSASYREALKYHLQNQSLKVVEGFQFDKPSTKLANQFLQDGNVKKALVVLPQDADNAKLSFRNIKDVKVLHENNLNVVDLLRYEHVVVTSTFFEQLKERYGL